MPQGYEPKEKERSMQHKGARHEGGDYFDDIVEREDAGVFGGLGVEDYEGVKESIKDDGIQVRMNCRVCGKEHDVTLEWKELFIVGTNGPGVTLVAPPGWTYSDNNGKLYPANIPCSKCHSPLCPMVTPDEARQRVNDAVSRGVVQVGAVQQWSQQVNMYRQQQGG
jgi:hypothetical protein